MYHSLTGHLIEKSPTSAVIDIGGVAYHVLIPVSTYSGLPDLGQTVRLMTHLVVREDSHSLYGFITEEEKRLFRLLISVSGIGPKMAVTVLSGVSLAELKRAIVEGALPVLTAVPGIGRKTAERMIVELREKLVVEGTETSAHSSQAGRARDSLVEDSLQALIALGYRRQNAREAIEKALKTQEKDNLSVEGLIRSSLKYV